MASWTTTVTESNQVNIPSELASQLNIQPGTRLQWEKTGEGAILVRPLPDKARLARELLGAGRQWLQPQSDPIGDLVREREQDRQLDGDDLTP
jgi:AbrB family looped-hinge helix DNA binding protein